MKTVIAALNSKYIHSSLAPWYLKAACEGHRGEIKVLEYTINESMDAILSSMYMEKSDVAAFSCYIWNIEYVLKLAENLKKVSPKVIIVLGGPEVSFNAGHIFSENGFVDYIIKGEGEKPFSMLVKYLCGEWKGELRDIPQLVYRGGEAEAAGKFQGIAGNLDSIPSPYTPEMLSMLENKIVYYESSRGCPFSCSYCLSSVLKGVRYFSMDRVKSDLDKLVGAGVSQVKFIDRTFNSDKDRAKEIFKHIIERFGRREDIVVNFHFEAAADLFDLRMLEILKGAPPGLIQFEIGIQTTNIKTLRAVNRKTDLKRLFENAVELKDMGNIHIHLDLIAGLPHEDMTSFVKSFDAAASLRPHQLQLGFLKLLNGSQLKEQAGEHGYRFRDYPPYEVLYNNYISFDDMLWLKQVEQMVDRYYNAGRFTRSLQYIMENYFDSAFQLYYRLSVFSAGKGYLDRPVPGRMLYTILSEFIASFCGKEDAEVLCQLLKLDFLSSDNSNNLPSGLDRIFEEGFKDRCFEFLRNEDNVKRYLPLFSDLPAKQIFKQVHFEIFSCDLFNNNGSGSFAKSKTVVLFDYKSRDRVTGLYRYAKLASEDFYTEV
ncbi:radical SAM superfamily enzyme YgiQ (UPF0313 family) [Anaerobacterium chartisolvens]|uniref:Radical SAM superfamily enzyme YgiQ (UPF0313 family) n=1 Tax=Anaerobacterium chartisolvens TaxID=1297424 RepID=A0A369B6N9_9FIRM|nr:B12-binding domain-containing radical SAM protein [Anaerobacterium chartisolvens]RCX17173.1 radical SAM superfamily enzyme YgiQ (UPF0313 family) [Anaerobacterium chartisolvens]